MANVIISGFKRKGTSLRAQHAPRGDLLLLLRLLLLSISRGPETKCAVAWEQGCRIRPEPEEIRERGSWEAAAWVAKAGAAAWKRKGRVLSLDRSIRI